MISVKTKDLLIQENINVASIDCDVDSNKKLEDFDSHIQNCIPTFCFSFG